MRQTTPSIPFNKFVILLWKCSGAEVIPKGSLLNRYLPAGVINVVSRNDSLARGIFQKPELASNFEKYRAPDTCARVCSTAGSMWRSRITFVFSFVRSTHILTFPRDLGTTTIPAHHSVGSSTRERTPSCSILFSSFLTAGSKGMDTFLGVLKAKGVAPSLS